MLHMGMELLTSKLQGGCRYLLDREPGTDNLKVTDTETGKVMDAIYVGESKRESKHWRVNLSHVKPTHPWRYFNDSEYQGKILNSKIPRLSFSCKKHPSRNWKRCNAFYKSASSTLPTFSARCALVFSWRITSAHRVILVRST